MRIEENRFNENPQINEGYNPNLDQSLLKTAITLAQNAPLDVVDDPEELIDRDKSPK